MTNTPDNQAFPKSLPGIPASLRVTWNGRPLVVHQARVSAFPFNRVWAGFQRPLSQTKPAAFVSFDMDGPGELAIGGMAEAACPDSFPVILPLAAAPACQRDGDGSWRIAIDRPRQFVVVFGDGAFELHIFANPPFIEAQSGGASGLRSPVRRFGPGEHDVGVVIAKSGETIVIEEGAIVYGSILVANAHDVRIVGRGIIDGSRLKRADHGSSVWKAAVDAGLPPGFYGAEMAVNGLTVFASERVAIEGIIFRDPPRWTVIVRGGSLDITIDNVKIVGCWRYNSDGINVCASENVAISDCFIRSFDDCLIARGDYLERDGPVTRGVIAERCTLWCDWGKCMEVWAGHRPCLIENVRFRDIAVLHPSGVVCDVTTWFASSDTRIRDIAFEDIEVDFALPLWRERIQDGDESFPAELRAEQRILQADCSRYGRYLGNQHWEPTTDLSSFRVRYEDIAVRRIRCLGAPPRLLALIDASTSPHTIERVTLEDLPPDMELTCKGLAEEVHVERPHAKEDEKRRLP